MTYVISTEFKVKQPRVVSNFSSLTNLIISIEFDNPEWEIKLQFSYQSMWQGRNDYIMGHGWIKWVSWVCQQPIHENVLHVTVLCLRAVGKFNYQLLGTWKRQNRKLELSTNENYANNIKLYNLPSKTRFFVVIISPHSPPPKNPELVLRKIGKILIPSSTFQYNYHGSHLITNHNNIRMDF